MQVFNTNELKEAENSRVRVLRTKYLKETVKIDEGDRSSTLG